MNTRRPFLRWTLSFAALAAFGASAQQAGTLYDPEPPADSAYVRFIVLGSGAVDVLVDGKPRVTKLAAGTPSDYLVQSVPYDEIEHLVDAVLPPVAHARLLAMRAGQPCLLLTRRTFNAGQVVTWARLWHPADRYQLGGRFSRRSD